MVQGRSTYSGAQGKPAATMKTIDKAMHLLGFFSLEEPEQRLSDLARAAQMDKATAMRILASLAAGGLIEQHPESRKYRLGTAVLHLARLREASFPVVAILQPILDELAARIGESTHACLFSGASMTTIATAEPQRATRVFINPAQALPLHATASGLAYVAHMQDDAQKALLKRIDLKAHTHASIKTRRDLDAKLVDIRARGLACTVGSFDDDVTGIAAPIFDWHGNVQATISAACITSRLDDRTQHEIEAAVMSASQAATRAMGGASPHHASLLERKAS